MTVLKLLCFPYSRLLLIYVENIFNHDIPSYALFKYVEK